MGFNETYVIFLYADGLLQWTNSGGPLAGYTDGNDTILTYTEVEDLTQATNIECLGVWVIRIDTEDPVFPKDGKLSYINSVYLESIGMHNFFYTNS